MTSIACSRCGRPDAPALTRSPYPGPVGQELLAHTCTDCWNEWQGAEVMVINELRLNFMDPQSQDILVAEMRRFLQLEA